MPAFSRVYRRLDISSLDIAAIVTAVFGGLIGFAGIIISIITAVGSAKKNDLETLKVVIDAVTAENIRLSARLKFLEDEKARDTEVINIQAAQIRKLESQVSILQRKVIELGGKIDTGPLPLEPGKLT